MAGRGSPEESRKGFITCGNGHYRRQSWLTNHMLRNIGRKRKCSERTGGSGSVVLVEEDGTQRRKRQ